MKKILATLALAAFSIAGASAQQMQDVVYLKNGSVIRGQVMEQVGGGNIRIVTADGSTFVYPMADVERITKERAARQSGGSSDAFLGDTGDELYGWERAKRFRAFIESAYTFGVGDYCQDRGGITASFGCQITPYFYLGAGTGFNYWLDEEVTSVPVFVHARSEFHKAFRRNASPFIEMKLGYSAVNAKGFMMSPAVGCHFYFGHSVAGISIVLGYEYLNAETTSYYYGYYSGHSYFDTSNNNWGGVRLGVAVDF